MPTYLPIYLSTYLLREIYFMELSHVIEGLESLNSVGQDRRPKEELMLQLKSKGSLEAEFLLCWESQSFSRKSFN